MPSKLKEYKEGEEPKLHRVHIAMEREIYFGKWTEGEGIPKEVI